MWLPQNLGRTRWVAALKSGAGARAAASKSRATAWSRCLKIRCGRPRWLPQNLKQPLAQNPGRLPRVAVENPGASASARFLPHIPGGAVSTFEAGATFEADAASGRIFPGENSERVLKPIAMIPFLAARALTYSPGQAPIGPSSFAPSPSLANRRPFRPFERYKAGEQIGGGGLEMSTNR